MIYILAEQKCEDIDVLDEYHRHIYSELLRAFKEYKKSLKVDKSSNDFNEQEISIHIDKLEKMLQRFEEMGLYYMKKILQENHALWDDLWNGGEKLADVRRNMEQCDKGLIRSLVDICDCNAVYLEKRHYKTGVVEDETLNKMGIEFMLRLYYRRKFKSARIENKGDD